MIGVDGGDDPFGGIVDQDRAHALDVGELEEVTLAGRQLTEIGLVLAHRLALVVEDRPPAAHPTQWAIRDLRLRLDLLLHLATEAIRVAEADLHLGLLPCLHVGIMGLPHDRALEHGFSPVLESEQVIDQP